MAETRFDRQLPAPSPRRNRSLDGPDDGFDEAALSGAEQRLAQHVRDRRGHDESLLALLAALPPMQRFMARILFTRELGGARATQLFARAFGNAWAALPALSVGPPPQADSPRPNARARYDHARAQALVDVLTAARRHEGTLDAAVVGDLFAATDPHVALAVRSLLRRSGQPAAPSANDGGHPPLRSVSAPRTRTFARAATGAGAARKAAALHQAAERHAVTLYRRDSADATAPDPEDPAVEEVLRRLGGGDPLPDHVRLDMEARFGLDFRRVRVHTDVVAGRAARAVGARAFTTGEDIFFAAGAFVPDGVAGRQLLAHELAHVAQHYQGRVASAAAAGARVSHPSDMLEVEADAAASRILQAGIHGAAKSGRSGAPSCEAPRVGPHRAGVLLRVATPTPAAPADRLAFVREEGLNLRAGPGRETASLMQMKFGQRVHVLDTSAQAGWRKVKEATNTTISRRKRASSRSRRKRAGSKNRKRARRRTGRHPTTSRRSRVATASGTSSRVASRRPRTPSPNRMWT